MEHLLRPRNYLQLALLAGIGAALAASPPGAHGQAGSIIQILQEANPLLSHNTSQGYLGVMIVDVDNESAARLKLKEVRGAVITLIDHDAPAGQNGLRANDVIVELDGQRVDGAEQFTRMMRDLTPGKKIGIAYSRDGVVQSVTVQLVDRKKMEDEVWNKMNNGYDGLPAPTGKGLFSGGDTGVPGWHMPFVGSNSLKVGAMVEPLSSQTAEYLGVSSGVFIKRVASKSEAAAAGLRANDVIVKVGGDSIATTADWDRALLSNQNKQVQLTIQRDRKLQTLTLQVDSKHRSDTRSANAQKTGLQVASL